MFFQKILIQMDLEHQQAVTDGEVRIQCGTQEVLVNFGSY